MILALLLAMGTPVPNMTKEYLGGIHYICPKGWNRKTPAIYGSLTVCWRWRTIYWEPKNDQTSRRR